MLSIVLGVKRLVAVDAFVINTAIGNAIGRDVV